MTKTIRRIKDAVTAWVATELKTAEDAMCASERNLVPVGRKNAANKEYVLIMEGK